jgi:hypothetical protein
MHTYAVIQFGLRDIARKAVARAAKVVGLKTIDPKQLVLEHADWACKLIQLRASADGWTRLYVGDVPVSYSWGSTNADALSMLREVRKTVMHAAVRDVDLNVN